MQTLKIKPEWLLVYVINVLFQEEDFLRSH